MPSSGHDSDEDHPRRAPLQPKNLFSACSCGRSFNLLRKKSWCRYCGYVYCSSCLSQNAVIPQFSYNTPVPVCGTCAPLLEISDMDDDDILKQNVSKLKEFANWYGVDTRGCLEKRDFVGVVRGVGEEEEFVFRGNIGQTRNQQRNGGANSDARGGRSTPTPAPSPATGSGSGRRQQAQSYEFFGTTNGGVRDAAEAMRRRFDATPTGNVSGANSHQQPTPPHTNGGSQPGTPLRQNGSGTPSMGGVPHTPTTPSTPSTSTTSQSSTPSATPKPSMLTLSQLLSNPVDLHTLSAATLKSILRQNHVDISTILEKSELIDRVNRLLESERRDRAQTDTDIAEDRMCKSVADLLYCSDKLRVSGMWTLCGVY
ncbi:hypothetical protein BC832DRAFT_538462 [Gaertneriomyces semiglobifer]|nr:hypothetical protein BC832DRAFT_538462 [Gaertneriomyces semiglobifer]